MKGMAALISTVILSAGSWLALHASLHNALLSYSWLDSINGTRSEADAAVKQGFGEEATNTSTYCALHSPVERSISMPPLASNDVIEITSLKSLCDAWHDDTAKQYKAIKYNSCPFWLHEHNNDKATLSGPGPKISIVTGNARMQVAGASSTQTSKYNQIEGRWRAKSTHFIRQIAQSVMRGVGNQLSELYLMKYAAAILGIPVINACADMDGPRDCRNGTIQSLLPTYDDDAGHLHGEIASTTFQDICNLEKNYQKFPHTCPHCLASVAASIRRDMRAVAHKWTCENKNVDLDEATIHVRCGDFITGGWAEYGFLPYRAYTRILPQTTKSIGIITSTFDEKECRSNDCSTIGNCKGLIMDLQSFLEENYPNATITIRNGPEETLASTFSRITLSRRTVCSPSTFCLYPAIATLGEGHFANTVLYPFVHDIATQPGSNIRVIEEDFLSTKRMKELSIGTIENLTKYLRRTSSEKVENR